MSHHRIISGFACVPALGVVAGTLFVESLHAFLTQNVARYAATPKA